MQEAAFSVARGESATERGLASRQAIVIVMAREVRDAADDHLRVTFGLFIIYVVLARLIKSQS